MRGNKRKKLKVAVIASLPVAVILLAALLMYGSEHFSEKGVGFWTIVERILIVLMGEYPEQPITVAGRIVQLIVLMLSTVLVGAIFGKISSVFVGNLLRKEGKMKTYKDFVVVCNWNKKAKGIISELLRSDDHMGVVVIHSVEPNEADYFREHERVSFCKCDPMRYEVLTEQRVWTAKSVVLLLDEGVENPDDKNALIALAIKHLEDANEDVHVVVELADIERRKHLLDAGADEVICSTDYTAGIIAQSAIYNRMSNVYERLLSYSSDTNEIYFVEGVRGKEGKDSKPHSAQYPASFEGMGFAELVAEVNRLYEARKEPVLLIGIKRGQDILLNPKTDKFSALDIGDDLIVMSYEKIMTIG
jgi:voltage-gated potassium channel